MADMHRAGRVCRDIFDIDLLAGTKLRAAVVGSGRDDRSKQALPVADGKPDVDEARTGDGDVGYVGIFLQLGDDDFGERARIGPQRLCQHHRGIGRDIAVACITRRLDGDAAEIELGSLFLDDINLFKGVLNPGFEVGKKVHRTLPCIGSAAAPAAAPAAYRKSGVRSNNRLWALIA